MQRPCSLREEHHIRDFDCGNDSLNQYLKEKALKSQQNDSARTFVVVEDGSVIAYYTVSSSAVAHAEAPGRLRRNRPDPVPAVLLGRFAVDSRFQGRKIGSSLLQDALLRLAKASNDIGIAVIIVDAISDEARRFYQERGFKPFVEESMRLYLLLKDLREALGLNDRAEPAAQLS
jgi:GNAT superfamily N-acetyltransferase